MNKILYPPLIFIGSSIPIYIFALIDRSVDSIVTICIWSLLLLFILWKSMDNFWINRRLPVMCPNNYKSVKVVGNNSEQKSDIKGDYSYGTFARLTKKNASPENIKLVRQTLIDLAKDDYSNFKSKKQNIFG